MTKVVERETPSMEAASEAVRHGVRIDTGQYRSVYRTEGSYWAYKVGNCQSNEAEFEASVRLKLELAASSGFDWVRIPEVVLMEDHHYIAVEYIEGEGDDFDFDWCDEYYPEYCGEHCKRHRIESTFNLEDLHAYNVIRKNGYFYLIDLGGAWWPDTCCNEEEDDTGLMQFTWEDPWSADL